MPTSWTVFPLVLEPFSLIFLEVVELLLPLLLLPLFSAMACNLGYCQAHVKNESTLHSNDLEQTLALSYLVLPTCE